MSVVVVGGAVQEVLLSLVDVGRKYLEEIWTADVLLTWIVVLGHYRGTMVDRLPWSPGVLASHRIAVHVVAETKP